MAKRRRDESPEKQALREMMNGYLKENPVKNGTDVNGLMREMMSVILEGSLDGEMELDVPRDRDGEFEPKIIKKYQNTLTQDMEEKIMPMYAKGMTKGADPGKNAPWKRSIP